MFNILAKLESAVPVISIHTFLAEGDYGIHEHFPILYNFNPHLPCGRWPSTRHIHCCSCYFNPHLPCGRWRAMENVKNTIAQFQSTPSLRKVTSTGFLVLGSTGFQSTPSLRKVTTLKLSACLEILISIHTFLAEGDPDKCQILFWVVLISCLLYTSDAADE